jgi:hypothetical protein
VIDCGKEAVDHLWLRADATAQSATVFRAG